MAQTIRSSGGAGGNGHGGAGAGAPHAGARPADTRPADTRPADTQPAATEPDSARPDSARPTAPHAGADVRPAARARHIVGQLAALPRLARGVDAATESAAERIARRRRVARATLDAESGVAETDWARVGVFGAGVAVGTLIGAGLALLLAPATGYETRTRIARRARQAGGRAADRWEDVSDDLRDKARHGARRVKRAATTSRWAVEDAWERQRRD